MHRTNQQMTSFLPFICIRKVAESEPRLFSTIHFKSPSPELFVVMITKLLLTLFLCVSILLDMWYQSEKSRTCFPLKVQVIVGGGLPLAIHLYSPYVDFTKVPKKGKVNGNGIK